MSAGSSPARSRVFWAVLALIGANLFWAGNYIVGESAVQSIDPLSLVFLRWALAAVPLLVLAQLIEKPDWRAVLATWRWQLVSSLLGVIGFTLLLYIALQYTDAFNASLISAVNPALIVVAAAIVLREKLTPVGIAGVVAALIGVIVILSGGDLGRLLTVGFGWGEVLMLGAVLAWTGYSVIGRVAPKTPPIAATAVQVVIAVVLLAPISFATGGPKLPQTSTALWALLFIALLPSVGSYLLWNSALTVIPPSRAGVFLNLITVFVALFTIVAGHPYTLAQIIGGVIVTAGVVATNLAGTARSRARTQT